MSPLVRTGSTALAGLLFASTLSFGQARPLQLVISGGLTLPAGDLGNLHDSGFHYDASLLLNLPGLPVRIRPEFSLTQLKLKDNLTGNGSADDVTSMYAALGNLEFPLVGGLYVLAGGGLLSLSLPEGASTGAGESARKLALEAGAGLRFQLAAVSGFIEARMGTASYNQGKFGFSKAQFIPVSFGLAF